MNATEKRLEKEILKDLDVATEEAVYSVISSTFNFKMLIDDTTESAEEYILRKNLQEKREPATTGTIGRVKYTLLKGIKIKHPVYGNCVSALPRTIIDSGYKRYVLDINIEEWLVAE